MRKFFVILLLAVGLPLTMVGCSEADVASQNVSRQADQFQVDRRIVATNLITGDYLFMVTGKCSLGNGDTPNSHTITCKVGDQEYQKHFVEAPDGANVVITTEQINTTHTDPYHYEWIFRPEVIVPTIVR